MTTPERRQYKAPTQGASLMTTLFTGLKTPIVEVKFSNLIKPFYYPNSPNIPRYSVTCALNPEVHEAFIESVARIEKTENVESILKNDSSKEEDGYIQTGKILLKFQSKNKVPTFVIEGDGHPEEIDLQDELAKGEKIHVMYDVLRFTKKNSLTAQYGLSFKPTAIYFYPQ